MKTLKELDLKNKKIILRCDFNVPVENGKVVENERIDEALRTIDYILDQGPKMLLLVSHLGRPGGKKVPELSLEPVYKELNDLTGEEIVNVKNVKEMKLIQGREGEFRRLYFLENIRFWPEEESASEEFAEEVMAGVDVYINDAFSSSHRDHASITKFPKFAEEKCMGFLFEEELTELTKVKDDPQKPSVAIIGGAKIATKLPVINKLSNSYDWVLVGGKVANEALDEGLNLGEKVLLPVDFSPEDEKEKRFDIGVETLKNFEEKIKEAKFILYNGPMGMFEEDSYSNGTKKIIEMILNNKDAYKVVGGGETIGAIEKFSSLKEFDYVSMSGGAMLEFLGGKELPGIKALDD
ncbi:MAG: phosphoglycerate kinase [Patescibacteria group bacterium]|jgi:3-phosphoglycerate kinase|nr:phosphoglycerate kinase [Patescibacteria group bacterium]